jgi:hypothetical protein
MRIKLSEKYYSEREQICNELISLIELDSDGCFLLSKLDLDSDKQNKILEMKENWFNCKDSFIFYVIPECVLINYGFIDKEISIQISNENKNKND